YRVAGTKNLTRQPIDARHKSRFSIEAAPPLKIDEFEAVDEYEKPFLAELAKARMQAIDATVEEFSGRSSSLKLAVGALFTLEGHRRADQNRKYLVVAASYQFEGDLPDGSPAAEDPYRVFFAAIDSETPFSPPVLTKKPVVQGPHLATVTEETDEYGRVLVQFHWGNTDGDIESCRARVSQNWAGKEWGGVFLPHKGHEVIVEFLDGDPDQPLVTGRVYNKESMPPLSLPGDKQKSIIRDHGGNEIMMDGTSDAQKIHIYCPKHESEIWLGKSIELKSASNWINDFLGFKQEDVKKDSTSNIGGNSSTTVTGNTESKVTGNSKEAVGGDKEENIVGKVSVKGGFDFFEFFVGAKHEGTIGAKMESVHGMKMEIVNGVKITRGKNKEVLQYKDLYQKAGITKVDADDYWLEAKQKIDLKTADMQQVADNTMKLNAKEGTVEFATGTWKGKEHSHQPSSRFEVKTGEVFVEASSNIVLEGKRIGLCGSVFEVKA
ncbi:MAG TPA: type VI secretion system tip protein TssI/VgrG, partial [Planctomycetota bacterium]|nr:type VI secretion system tip protein TssI/VgrG [Planctomycetota bacterium]